VDALPAGWGADADGVTGPGAGHEPDAAVLPVLESVSESLCQGVIGV
jgi:hypothetical protein